MKVKNDHRSKFSNLSNWKEEAWKNQGFNGIRTRDLRVAGALLYQLSYEATHWERGQFIELFHILHIISLLTGDMNSKLLFCLPNLLLFLTFSLLSRHRIVKSRDFKIQLRGRQRERQKKTIGFISKTTTSHVHRTYLYISFPFLHDYDVKMPNFAFYGERKQAKTKFNFSFWTWIWSLGI